MQVAPRIVNYLVSSLRIINYFPFLIVTDAERYNWSLKKLFWFLGLAIRKLRLFFSSKLGKVDLEGRESKHSTAVSQGHLRESNQLLIWSSAFGGQQTALYSTVKGDTLLLMVLTLKIQ